MRTAASDRSNVPSPRCPRTIEDLAGHAGIVHGQSGRVAPWRIVDDGGRIHELRMRSALQFDDMQVIADAAAGGAGLAWLPCWLMARQLQAGELVLVMNSERVLATRIHAV